MACVALTSLISTIELEFLQPTPRVSFHDQALIKSFLEKLSSLQAFLQKESSGDAAKDLEIKIRDFALKAEDDIEIQLSNFLLAEDREHRKKSSQELLQTLREAAELLKIITREKDSREREMVTVALTSLLETIEREFLQPTPRVSLHDRAPIKSFFENLSSLQAFLQKESGGGGATIKDLEIQIRDFALKAEDDIEMQLSNILLSEDTEYREKASRELHQTLREAAKIAAELLKIINKEKEHEREREMTCVALTSIRAIIEEIMEFLQPNLMVSLHDKAEIESFFGKLSSLQVFLREESSGGGATTKITDFALKADEDIQIQIRNFFQAKDTKSQEKVSRGLHQALQEATENATELMKIIPKEKECDDEIEKACVDLSSLMGTIEKELLDNEAVRKSFLEKISSLQAFLQKESSGGAALKDLETKIKHFAPKAGYNIKIQKKKILRANYKGYEEIVSKKLHQTMLEAVVNAAKLLKIINSRSNEVDEANETQTPNSWLKHASKSGNVESYGSSQSFLKLEDRMVGRHHDCRAIKDQLYSSRSKLKIISIVGMVGIGKTTLAKYVYKDPSVASQFDVQSWITIPQDYNKTRMLSDLLQSITPGEPNVIRNGSTPDELEIQVRKCLLGRKYLIVLDNILSNQALIDIRQCVPNDRVGSCILLTTSHFKRDYYDKNYTHNMTLLDPKESWELFCNILPIKEHMAPKFEKIRNHVVEKCDGLPQLIVEVAKRLSKCNNIQKGWKKIEKELESLGILDRNALTVSYNSLPHHLKVCFLYFGVFPKRNRILVKMLIRLWIVEGFVKPLEHKELENQAYEYLEDLIDRSLLLIENRSSDSKIKTCRMHSALHSFCVGEAQKEGISCAVNTQKHSGLSLDAFANSCRWLSLCSHSFDYYVLFSTNISRSIFFFHEIPKMFVPLKLLRVLAFDTSIFLQRVPLRLGDLIFLRYLSITQWFEDLDYVVSNNPNLQTLVVSGNGAPTVHLPSSIWKPPHLRHLELGNSYMVDPPSTDKKNLQTLSWVVTPIHCRKEVYNKFPNIKKMKIFLKDDIEPNHTRGSCSNPIILDNFDYLKGLEKLSISVSIGCNAALPKQSMFPSQLKKLKLSGTNLSKRDLTVIAMLPQLMVLKLENAFHGTVWEVSERGFCNLRFLLLEDRKLEQWVARYGSFPWLQRLVLRFCYCLEQIPKRFAEIYPMKSIELEGCHSSLAKQVQLDRGLKNLEIKILDPKYDESQNTHTEVSM